VYNTLTDGLESINIAAQQGSFVEENANDFSILRQKLNFDAWITYTSKWQEWVWSNREYWSKPNSRNSLLESELARIKKEKTTQPLSVFLARYLVQQKRTADFNAIKKIDANQKGLTERNKSISFENVKQQSLNLALENIWGLWQSNKSWIQSNAILENQ